MGMMPLPPAVMRACLLLCLIGMAILAAFYLRRRRLSALEYVGWGLVAILFPLVGPFIVILSRPGIPIRRLPGEKLKRRKIRRGRRSIRLA